LISENEVNIPEEAESFLVDMELNAKTGILVAYDGDFIGLVGVTDPLKREAAVVIEGLKKMGVYPVMVTGDNWRTALAVAKEVGWKFLCSSASIRISLCRSFYTASYQ
jgi:Cu+-exporting ATPase